MQAQPTISVLWSDLKPGDKIATPRGDTFTVASTHKHWDGSGAIVVLERWERQPLVVRWDTKVDVILPPISGGSPEPFALVYSPPSDPIDALPWRLRPIARFLRKEAWTTKDANRIEDYSEKIRDAIEDYRYLAAYSEDNAAHLAYVNDFRRQLKTFLKMARRGPTAFPAGPAPVAPPHPGEARTPENPAPRGSRATPGKPRTAESIIREAIDVCRCENDRFSPFGSFDAMTPPEKSSVTRYLNSIDWHAGKPRYRFRDFIEVCCRGVQVEFPEKAAPPVPHGWAEISADDTPEKPDDSPGKPEPAVPGEAPLPLGHPDRCGRCEGRAETHVNTRHFGREHVCRGCAAALLADVQTRGISQGNTADHPGEAAGHPDGQFDPDGRIHRANMLATERGLRAEVAEVVDIFADAWRDGLPGVEVPATIAARRWSYLTPREQRQFVEWLEFVGYRPGFAAYGKLSPEESWCVFLEESVFGVPTRFVRPPTPGKPPGSPGKPEPTPGNPTPGKPVVRIGCAEYALSGEAGGFTLEKPDGTAYTVTQGPVGPLCTCPSAIHRTNGIHGLSCKHIRYLANAGLLTITPKKPEDTMPDLIDHRGIEGNEMFPEASPETLDRIATEAQKKAEESEEESGIGCAWHWGTGAAGIRDDRDALVCYDDEPCAKVYDESGETIEIIK